MISASLDSSFSYLGPHRAREAAFVCFNGSERLGLVLKRMAVVGKPMSLMTKTYGLFQL